MKKNALSIFIPHLAFEVNYFCNSTNNWVYDELNHSQEFIPLNKKLNQFDKVSIHLSIDNTKRTLFSKVKVKLIKPFTVEEPEETIDDKPNKKIKV